MKGNSSRAEASKSESCIAHTYRFRLHKYEMTTALPLEIIQKIADNVRAQDCLDYQYVSRAWMTIFRKKIYRNVEIPDRRRFRQFLAALEYSQSTAYPIGPLVEKLVLSDSTGIIQRELELLQDLLPNLHTLHFHERLWCYLSVKPSFSKWTKLHCVPVLPANIIATRLLEYIGPQLMELTLGRNHLDGLDDSDTLLSTLAKARRLQRLILYYTPFPCVLPKFVHSLCQMLPQLKYLDLRFVCLGHMGGDIPSDDISTFDHFEELHVSGEISDKAWGQVLPRMFPNLKKLELEFLWWSNLDPDDAREFILGLLSRLPKLQHISLYINDQLLPSLDRIYAVLKDTMQSMQHIRLEKGNIYPDDFKDIRDLLDTNIRHLATTVRLEQNQFPSRDFLPFSQLSTLKLYLATIPHTNNPMGYAIELNDIVSVLPRLKRLHLFRAHICGQVALPSTCKLQEFSLNYCSLGVGIVDQLSQRCPDLRRLILDCVVIPSDGLRMEINLPTHSLEYLYVKQIRLVPSNRFATLLCLTRTAVKRQGKTWQRWYSERLYQKSKLCLRRLLPEHAAILQQIQTEEDWEQRRNEVSEKEEWKDNVMSGCIRVVCKNVQKLRFNLTRKEEFQSTTSE